MSAALEIVFLGLSLSSSWGNGHATTYRALLKGLAGRGHRLTFLERDVPWYAAERDLPNPDFCELVLYRDTAELADKHAPLLRRADAVVLGSYVPDGIAVAEMVLAAVRAGTPVAFYDIDTPVTLATLDAGTCAYLSRDLIPRFDVYLSFTGGRMLARLEQELGARRAAAFFCAVDADRYRPTGHAVSWDLGYLGTYSADRQPALQRLLIEPARRLPDRRFVVAGPQYPADIDWPDNVERFAHVSPDDHPEFYTRCRFTLNVTRADMIAAGWSPSVRLFEAAACASPILSDAWDGLTELFPAPDAIRIANSSADVVEALTALPEAGRIAMAETARSIVLAGHTGDARAAQLERILDEVRGARPAEPAVLAGSAA